MTGQARGATSEAGGVDSPCVRICRLDTPSGRCIGCLRTLAEIGAWGTMGEPERAEVLRRVARRRASLRLGSSVLPHGA